MRRRKTKASVMALCGVLGALALVCLFLGGVVPVATLSCPILASLVLIPVYQECGCRWGTVWYAAVSVLGLLLAPMKECAILFVAFGSYPMLRKPLGRLPLSKLWKHGYFNVVLLAAYGLMLFVLQLTELTEEFAQFRKWMLLGLLLLANVTFYLYDLLIGRLEVLYIVRFRNKLLNL